jgi:formate/nitrite transporter
MMSSTQTPTNSIDAFRFDPYAPAEMAARVQTAGVNKARLDFITLATLGVLAGAFIAVGAQLSTIVGTGSELGFGPTRLLAGIAFSTGLILVVIAGAELFTGNTLIVMAWLGRKVPTGALMRSWGIAYVANFVGAIATVALVYWAGQWKLGGDSVGASALATATSKVNLSFEEALFRGILCNALVNLAVWLCFSARSNIDKIFSIIPPIACFVAAGFEHSIANMYLIPIGILLKDKPEVVQTSGLSAGELESLTWQGFFVDNLLPVTIGNIIGGSLLVAAIYWLVYLRPKEVALTASHDRATRPDSVQGVPGD